MKDKSNDTPPPQPQMVGAKPIALISEGTLRHLLQDTGGTFRISAPKWPTETETIPLYLAVPPAAEHVMASEAIASIAAIKAALAHVKVEAWEVDSEKMDDLSPPHHEYALFNPEGQRLCGTENADAEVGMVHTDGPDEDGFFHDWNEPSKRRMEFIAACNPQAISNLIAALASVTVNNPATLEKSDFQKFDVEGERQENERETTKQPSPSPAEKLPMLDVEEIASMLYEAANPTMRWSYLYPSHNHLHAAVRQRFLDAAARFQGALASAEE